ncbi:MAG: PQQ-dependent sugar dehydrogenase, partial [Betaproteobacteria bacterium]
MHIRRRVLAFAAAFFVAVLTVPIPPSFATERSFSSEKHSFRLVTLVEGLENPWSIAFLPDGRMLVTERPGRLRIVSKDFKLEPGPVEGLPAVVEAGQGGLFDVVLHPR